MKLRIIRCDNTFKGEILNDGITLVEVEGPTEEGTTRMLISMAVNLIPVVWQPVVMKEFDA